MLKKVNILGKDYKITRKLPIEAIKQGFSDDSFMGLCMDAESTLYINKAYKGGEDYWATLFHEINHGVFYRNGVRNSGLIAIETEEIIVETMASVQYETTKAILKQILKEVKKSGKISTLSSLVEGF